MNDTEISNIRSKKIKKSNVFIQKSKFELSAQAQKAILFLISQVKTSDNEFQVCQFSIGEFCKICGICDSGSNYRELENTVKAIADKYSLWVPINGKEKLVRWVESAEIDPCNRTIGLRLNKELSEHLLHLSQNFTVYELSRVLAFKSKYSIRGYELICSIHYHPEETHVHTFTLNELRDRLGVDADAKSYLLYKNFKSRILNPVISEINNVSEKMVTFTEIKRGQTVTALEFTIRTKPEVIRETTLDRPRRQPATPATAPGKRSTALRQKKPTKGDSGSEFASLADIAKVQGRLTQTETDIPTN